MTIGKYVDTIKAQMAEIEEKFNSPTMCTAKWAQSSIHLMTGRTHSCHHPDTHIVPLDEIKRSPKALHNTEFKIERRKEMLAGQRPKECQYCWNIEDLGKDHVSDRTYKSVNHNWSLPYVDKILESGDGRDLDPAYLEVAFDNTCNLKCMYCSPDISSKWMEEAVQHGPYKRVSYNVANIEWLKFKKQIPIPQKDFNPYTEAFWEWWPELYQSLDTFRITGGEPLLSKNFWKVMDYIEATPRSDINLAVNTNLQIPDVLLDRFIAQYNKIRPGVKNFTVYTSAEATGEQAGYIRTGLEYNSFMANVRRVLSETTANISMMITFNALSLTTFQDFLSDLHDIRKEFNKGTQRLFLMINYLRHPDFQCVQVVPSEIRDFYLNDALQFMKNNRVKVDNPWPNPGFGPHEIDQMERLIAFANEPIDESLRENMMADFGGFFSEYDERRGCDFESTFPDLWAFYQECLMLADRRDLKR